MSKVTEWKMIEEERLAYIAKHPIKPKEKPRRSATVSYIDWEWRGEKGNSSRYSKK